MNLRGNFTKSIYLFSYIPHVIDQAPLDIVWPPCLCSSHPLLDDTDHMASAVAYVGKQMPWELVPVIR